jgi:gluconate 2-dehydrogenase gamma chain
MNFSLRRRRLLAAGLVAPLGGTLAACGARENATPPQPLAFFTPEERMFVDAAAARLIPDGADNNGARAAAVPFFIERQLAGLFGSAQNWYMQGPWEKGVPGQGYQLAYTPAALYRAAIKNLDAYCRHNFRQAFRMLPTDKQDEILHQLENNDLKLGDIPGNAFFDMLWENTQEGYLADPMYGGNRNFVGWKLIGFPGPRYNYVADIVRYGQHYQQPPVGLLGRDGTRILKG